MMSKIINQAKLTKSTNAYKSIELA